MKQFIFAAQLTCLSVSGFAQKSAIHVEIIFIDSSAHFVMDDQPLKRSEELTNFITVE